MRFYLGIDAGVKTGYAIWNAELKKITEYGETTFWGIIEMIASAKKRADVAIIIEDPSQNKPVFDKDVKKDIFNPGKYHRKREKIAQNIGSNKREATLIIEYCEKYNIPYEAVRPTTKKWDQALFKSATKIKDKVSQHTMDAAKLIVGRI